MSFSRTVNPRARTVRAQPVAQPRSAPRNPGREGVRPAWNANTSQSTSRLSTSESHTTSSDQPPDVPNDGSAPPGPSTLSTRNIEDRTERFDFVCDASHMEITPIRGHRKDCEYPVLNLIFFSVVARLEIPLVR